MATKKRMPKEPETDPKDLGMLCLMAMGLASETAQELQRTGRVAVPKIAKTRLELLIGSANAILKHLRTKKAAA